MAQVTVSITGIFDDQTLMRDFCVRMYVLRM